MALVICEVPGFRGTKVNFNKNLSTLALGNKSQANLGNTRNIFMNSSAEINMYPKTMLSIGSEIKMHLDKTFNIHHGSSLSKYNINKTLSDSAIHCGINKNHFAGGVDPEQWKNCISPRDNKFENLHKIIIINFLVMLSPIFRLIVVEPVSKYMVGMLNVAIKYILEGMSLTLISLAQSRFAQKELSLIKDIFPVGTLTLWQDGIRMYVISDPMPKRVFDEEEKIYDDLERYSFTDPASSAAVKLSLLPGTQVKKYEKESLVSFSHNSMPVANIVTHLDPDMATYSTVDIDPKSILFLSNVGYATYDRVLNIDFDYNKYSAMFLQSEVKYSAFENSVFMTDAKDSTKVSIVVEDMDQDLHGSITMDKESTEIYRIGALSSFQIAILEKEYDSLKGAELYMDGEHFKLNLDGGSHGIYVNSRFIYLHHKNHSFIKIDSYKNIFSLSHQVLIQKEKLNFCNGVFEILREKSVGSLKPQSILKQKPMIMDIKKRKKQAFMEIKARLSLMEKHL